MAARKSAGMLTASRPPAPPAFETRGARRRSLDAVHHGRSSAREPRGTRSSSGRGGGEVGSAPRAAGPRKVPVHPEGVAEDCPWILAAHGHPGVNGASSYEPEPAARDWACSFSWCREAQVGMPRRRRCRRGTWRHRRAPRGASRGAQRHTGSARRAVVGSLAIASLHRARSRAGRAGRCASARVGVLCRGHVIERRLPGELAVCRPGLNVEVDVARAVWAAYACPLSTKVSMSSDHLGDMTGGAGLMGIAGDAERIEGRGGRAPVGAGDDVPGCPSPPP